MTAKCIEKHFITWR